METFPVLMAFLGAMALFGGWVAVSVRDSVRRDLGLAPLHPVIPEATERAPVARPALPALPPLPAMPAMPAMPPPQPLPALRWSPPRAPDQELERVHSRRTIVRAAAVSVASAFAIGMALRRGSASERER